MKNLRQRSRSLKWSSYSDEEVVCREADGEEERRFLSLGRQAEELHLYGRVTAMMKSVKGRSEKEGVSHR